MLAGQCYLSVKNQPIDKIGLRAHKHALKKIDSAILPPPLPPIQQQISKPKAKPLSSRNRLPGHKLEQHVPKIQDNIRIPLNRSLLRSDHEIHQLSAGAAGETDSHGE